MHVEMMKRQQVIEELAKHSHPQHFHALLEWSTAQLRGLLVYYRENK